MKVIYFVVSTLLLLWVAYFAYEQFTGDFRLANLQMDLPPRNDLPIPPLSHAANEALHQILDQEFVWLDQGHQVFAFQSQDGKYVLKIFKFKRLKPSVVTQTLMNMPLIGPYFERQEKRRVNRLKKLFEGYHVAYMHDRKYTGLIYVRLHRTDPFHHTVLLRDRLNIQHQIDLNEIYFAVQKKGRSTRRELSALLNHGHVELAKQRLRQLLDMYAQEYQQGVVDGDHNLIDNTGFVGDQPIRLDVGQLKYQPGNSQELSLQDLEKIALKRISNWLQKYYPQYHDALVSELIR